MQIILYSLLMLTIGCFTEEQIFETKTFRVGDDVNLTCPRIGEGSLYWIRIGSRNVPEILLSSSYSEFTHRRIRVETESETFALYIDKAKQSDSAVYYCVKIRQQNILKGTNLRVEGNRRDAKSSEGVSAKKRFNGCLKNVSSSDAQMCHCAAVACGEIFSGNKSSELNTQDTWDSKKDNTALYLLCVALALSLLALPCLIYSIMKLKRESCVYCNDTAAVALQTNAPAGGFQQNQQTDEDSMVYSTPTFISRKATRTNTRKTKPAEEESIYADVKTLGLTS